MPVRLTDMKFQLVAGVLLSLLLSACQTPHIQSGADAEVIDGNLVRVDHTNVDLAYIDPKADFTRFTAILLTPLGVDNVEIVQPSGSFPAPGRQEWVLTNEDKQRLQQDFRDAMQQQLSIKGGYPIVDSPGDNVLQISAILTRIAPTASKDDFRARPTGRNKVFTEGAGELGVTVIFGDSGTGEVLALAKDTRTGSTLWGVNNRVTNAAEVRRVFNAWGMQIRAQLDRVHNKE
jgi:hypothetical protein